MSITVKLMGDLGRFADSPAVVLEGGPLGLAEVLDELILRYPSLRSQLFDDQGGIRASLLLAVKGRCMKWPEDEGSIIEEGGEVLVMRYLAGG
jgi:hypothetical protein